MTVLAQILLAIPTLLQLVQAGIATATTIEAYIASHQGLSDAQRRVALQAWKLELAALDALVQAAPEFDPDANPNPNPNP